MRNFDIKKFFADLDAFIQEGSRHLEERLYYYVKFRKKIDKHHFISYLAGLDANLKSTQSKGNNPRYPRLLVAIALCKILVISDLEYFEAIKYLNKANKHQEPFAMFLMGYSYVIDQQPDLEKAVKWYEKASQAGCLMADIGLGNCYRHLSNNQRTKAKMLKDAVEHYKKVHKAGALLGTHYLGYCYELGIGVPADAKKAVECYEAAAKGGVSASIFNLGVCHEKGIGVPQNLVRAVQLYRIASDLGFSSASFNLAILYARNGTPKDIYEAIDLYIRAIFDAEFSHPEKCKIAFKNIRALLEQHSAMIFNTGPIAKACVYAIKRFYDEEVRALAKELLSRLVRDSFETQYWIALIPEVVRVLPVKITSVKLIRKDLNEFFNCLINDNVRTRKEKKPDFELLLKKFAVRLTGRQGMYIRSELGELEILRTTPNSFFSILPHSLLSDFANGMLENSKEKTSEELAVEAKILIITQQP